MPGLQVEPFAPEHLGDAAHLLAERHRRHRQVEPRLSERFENPGVTSAEIESATSSADASGAVAIRNGQLVGYLLGAPKADSVWGRNTWVESAGQALSGDEDTEIMRDLYAAAADRWVEEGRTAHYVVTPAYDASLLRAWFQLSFGHQHTHAIRDPLDHSRQPAAGVTLRRARREDIAALSRLELVLPQHQGAAPCFSAGAIPTLEEAMAEWESEFADPDFTTFVAERDGTVVGSAIGCSLTKSSSNNGLIRPDNAAFLAFAAVTPEARGQGVGRTLAEAVLAWAAEGGWPVVATDWRQTNLLSSRAWRSLGFVPTFLRLHRMIGH